MIWNSKKGPPPGAFRYEWIRVYREAARMSIEDLARATTLSYTTIQKVERGRQIPRADVIAAIVYVLDIDSRHLFARPPASTEGREATP